jgi:hypothetical protein
MLGIDQDARDQKSGQNEKEIDSHPPVSQDTLQVKGWVFVAGVDPNHHQDGKSTNRVELRNLASHGCNLGRSAVLAGFVLVKKAEPSGLLTTENHTCAG